MECQCLLWANQGVQVDGKRSFAEGGARGRARDTHLAPEWHVSDMVDVVSTVYAILAQAMKHHRLSLTFCGSLILESHAESKTPSLSPISIQCFSSAALGSSL